MLQGTPESLAELRQKILIHFHTIKGSARSLSLKNLTRLLHEAEELVKVQVLTDPNAIQVYKITCEKVKLHLLHYGQIEREKLGARVGLADEPRLGEMDAILLRKLMIELCEKPRLSTSLHVQSKLLIEQLGPMLFKSLADFQAELTEEIAIQAKNLNKLQAQLLSNFSEFWLHPEVEQALRFAMVHILGNTLDHGIETAEERRRLGKNPQGTIRMTMEPSSDGWLLAIEDDGRGLNLQALAEKARTMGIMASNGSDRDAKLAELIFQAELSTAEKITEYSGRGVGMAAVRNYLNEVGAYVEVKLREGQSNGQGGRPFVLLIKLPHRALLNFKSFI